MSANKHEFLAPLEPMLKDPKVVEIMVNGYENVYLERDGKLVKVDTPFRDDDHLIEVIQGIAALWGRKIDERSPIADFRLPDGSRVNAVLPSTSMLGPSLVIRKFRQEVLSAEELVRFGAWSEEIRTFLHACVRARLNIAVGGGTGSGKTTLLNVIAGMIPDEERIVVVENAGELQLPQRRAVPLESRPPDGEGKGEVTIRDLVRNSLRMRPDRIVVGEVRGGEALDIVQAMNTGHDGTMFSIHAGDPRDVLARLEMLMTSANPLVPLLRMREQIAAAIDLIVYIRRVFDGSRKVLSVTAVTGMQGDVVVLDDIFVYRQMGRSEEGRIKGYHTGTGTTPRFMDRIQAAGIDLPIEMFVPK